MTDLHITVVLSFAAVLILFAAGAKAGASPDPYARETRVQRDRRMRWWREARFGMFIHWGVYAVPAGEYNGEQVGGIGEWIMNTARIPVSAYRAFARRFNPTSFDAEAIVRLAKTAGMKYIVITTKHHDGFALFSTSVSDWCFQGATPFRRDPIAELAAACRRHGIRLGFYYSQAQDWINGGSSCNGFWDAAQQRDMDSYIDRIAVPQVRELLTRYGRGVPAVLWWDTPCDMTPERASRLVSLLSLQPGIIHNNRLGGGYAGDTETPEQHIPASAMKHRDWETCMTLNDTWGFKRSDTNWKSAATLVHNLIETASKGGNYLLNIGPDATGAVPEASVERLQAVGAWMRINGEAIYGTTAGPLQNLPWGRCTARPGRLYLCVTDWPANGRLAAPLLVSVRRAWLLARPRTTLTTEPTDEGLLIHVPKESPSPYAGVIVLDIRGDVQLTERIVSVDQTGLLTLNVQDARILGDTLRLETIDGLPSAGFWTNPNDSLEWRVRGLSPGAYDVVLTYACHPANSESRCVLNAGTARIAFDIQATASWSDFETRTAGRIRIRDSAVTHIGLRATAMPRGAVMNLRQIILQPAAAPDASVR